jgi:glycosyltransferase involved in cell wall biosynthesis
MAAGSPSFSIIIPTFKRPEALRDALTAVFALDYDHTLYEIVVVDDEGDGRAAQVVPPLDAQGVSVRVLEQTRRGAAVARNHGARIATRDVLLFVDDDIIVAPDHLRRHATDLERGPRTVVNGRWEFTPAVTAELSRTAFGRFRLALEESFQQEALGRELQDGLVLQELLGTWNMSIGRTLFWDLDGFDEQFPVAGAEDQEFSLRAGAAGCELLLDTTIVCLHNDNRLDLASYCAREERSASTMPFMARKNPDRFGEIAYVNENRPIRRDDPPALIAKKGVKALLASGPALKALHWIAGEAERRRAPEQVLHRIYRALLGLHLYRGFRSTWQS